MTRHPAPREDRLELPESWASLALPWRGRRTGEPVELDPEAPKRLRGLIDTHETQMRTALAIPANQPFAAAALRYLDGESDANGAGIIASLIGSSSHRKSSSHLRPELDAWVLEHGLAFATAATITCHSMGTWWRNRRADLSEQALSFAMIYQLGYLVHDLPGGIAALRGLIAAASPSEYDAVVAAVEPVRAHHPVSRFLAGLLLPEQETWAQEACREYQTEAGSYMDRLLWHIIGSPATLAASKRSKIDRWAVGPDSTATALLNLGTAALPLLTASLRQQLDTDSRRVLLEAIARVPTDEAFAYLLGHLSEPHLLGFAVEATARFPHRAARLLAARPDRAPEERPLLAGLAAAVPASVRAELPDAERAALASLLDHAPVPQAETEDLPPLLTAPPWTIKRGKRKDDLLEVPPAPADSAVHWAEGERDAWAKVESYWYFHNFTAQQWREYLGSPQDPLFQRACGAVVTYAPDPIAAEALELWDGEVTDAYRTDLQRILARFDAAAAPKVTRAMRTHPTHREALVPILSVDAARLAADWLARLKTARAAAVAWFDRHGGDGARMLVPDALGADRNLRRNAEGALAFIAARIGAAAVKDAAESYGREAAQGIQALLDADPLEPRGIKIPKPAQWIDPVMLPQVLLRGRDRALPADSVPHLVAVLAITSPEYPYAGLGVVAETCDRTSLAQFSRALFRLWISVGGPAKDGWALTQLAHFADDDTVRLLAPMVREWPGQSQHKRAVNGLGVLGAMGSEEALRAVQGIADKVKFKGLKEEAGRQITAIAADLGLSRDQLADRLVPDFGLGDDPLVLDYGPRRFTVVFDEQLKPAVADDTGKPRKALPKPGAKDDPELAGAAYQRFAALKKDLRTAAADQVARLEAALVNARTWTADEFRRYFAAHPLVKHLARRLVWVAEADGAATGFRIAEDGSYSDVADEAYLLPAGATVRLAHPILLDPKELQAWSALLADYEILQPFDQLGRPVMAFTREERMGGRLVRFEGAEVEVGRLLGLTKRGWHRAAPMDGGVEPGMYFPLPDGGFVTLALDPGIWVGMIAENPVQKLDGVRVSAREEYWSGTDRGAEPIPDGLDPLTASEILNDLDRITNPEGR